MRNTAVLVLALAGIILCGDGWAQCPLSGGGGSGMRGGSRMGGSGMRGGSRMGGSMGGARGMAGIAGQNAQSPNTRVKWSLQKAAMPAPASVAQIDQSKYEKIVGALSLSESQSKKLDEAKKKIEEQAKKLAKAQDNARMAYNSATTESACMSAGQQVMAAIKACQDFNANKDFEASLAEILTADQRAKLKELSQKA
jgi:hypothetical protein